MTRPPFDPTPNPDDIDPADVPPIRPNIHDDIDDEETHGTPWGFFMLMIAVTTATVSGCIAFAAGYTMGSR